MKVVHDPRTGDDIHVKCGGRVIDGTCVACGKKQRGGFRSFLHLDEPFVYQTKEVEVANRKAHRERIRSGKDIFKNA